jgi:hypothetical protein
VIEKLCEDKGHDYSEEQAVNAVEDTTMTGHKLTTVFNGYSHMKIVLVNAKSGDRYHKKGHFSLLGGEYQPSWVLEKNRTSLRKSNSPTTICHASRTHHRA